MRRVAELGEFGLIERIAGLSRRSGGSGSGAVRLGIGDDAALVRPPAGRELAITTDALVEGVHFTWATDAPGALGRRVLVASLSDLAAMGARPLACVLALAVPPSLEVARLDAALRGLLAGARDHACPLVGGNVSAAREASFTLTALGHVAPGRALRRRGARAGDRLFVTGVLGAAALARARAERGGAPVRRVPEPRLRAGQALAALASRSRRGGVGACIDVSDGLEADLGHLLEAAGRPLHAELDADRLPRPRGFGRACARLGLDPEALLRGGGEDYELLFSLRPTTPTRSLASRLGVAVAEIGRVVAGAGPPGGRGWRHF